MMKHLTIHIPAHLNLDEKETKNFLAAKLYECGKLSLGQAAELAGYSKETFMELLADYDVSFFNYSPGEIEKDIKNFERRSL